MLAALVAGRGERIEISLYDVALSALVNVSGSALVTGEEPGRHGNAHPSIVPYETFAAADGPITVAGANDGLYRRLCAAIERPDLAEDERYRTNSGRVEHREELVGELNRVFASRTADEWVERLRGQGFRSARCAACSRRSSTDERSRSIIRRSARCHSSRRRSGRGRKPGRRRCSASTRGRCSASSATTSEEIEALLLPSSA